METSDAKSGVIRFGDCEADLRSRELRKRGTRIRLPGQSFEVLALLLQHPGELVTREELRARLWPFDVHVDFENNLNTAVARLREALGDSAEKPRWIETLPRRGYRFIGTLVGPPSPLRRIKLAVLPLENLSGDPAQEYFSDGLTEELITQLGGLAPERLGVIARTSAMHYKGTRKDVARIGRELGVDYVVEGSVRRADDRVRISAQLIQVSDQTHLWAQSYDGGLGDILRVQMEVSQAITRRIEVTVSPRRTVAVVPEAYETYIKGLYHFGRFNPGDLRRAIEYFELAIEKDPRYAPAHAKLATTHALMGFFAYVPAAEAFPQAERAALAALELDDTHPDAHHALADAHFFHHWNLAAAEREYARAVELAPNDPFQRWGLSMFLGSMKEDRRRAVAEAELARELDPLSVLLRSSFGYVHLWSRRYDRAIQESRGAIDMDPNCLLAYYVLGLAWLAKESFEDAIAVFLEATQRFRDSYSVGCLGMSYGLAGRQAEAREALAELERRAASQAVSPASFAWVYIGLGDKQSALDWLERAFAQHHPSVLWLRCSPPFDPLRSEPRFQQLLARLPLLPRVSPRTS